MFYNIVETRWPHSKRLPLLYFLKIFNAKLKGKFVPVFPLKARKGSRGIAPLILDVLVRWM